jgi:acyl-CoA synthetase (NDP forming)
VDGSDFRRLTDPASVAVVGASNMSGSYGWRVLHILQEYGRDRRVYAVNPGHVGAKIQGLSAYASLRDLPEVPECTLVIAPPTQVGGVLADLGAIGARAGIVLSAPHGAGHSAARKFDQEVADIARQYGLYLIGPNSMGLISPATGYAATFGSGMLGRSTDQNPAPAGGIAMISQSGAAISYLLEEHRGRGIGYSHLISTGNETVVSFNDILECLSEDDATHTIVLFVEAVGDGLRMRRAITSARLAGQGVVMMKIGNSDEGRAAAESHSGRLGGRAAGYEALAADLGVIYVESYQHLFDTFRVLHAFPPRADRRIWSARRRAAVITTSGGAAVVAIDELRRQGWTVPVLSETARLQLDETLGGDNHDNPLDLLGLWRDEWRLAETLRILSRSGDVDAVVVALGGGGPAAPEVCRLAAEVAVNETRIPVIFAGLGMRADAQRALEAAGAAFVPDITRAVTGLNDRMRCAGAATVGSLPGAPEFPAETVEVRQKAHTGAVMPSGEVLRQLEEWGVSCAPFRVVTMDEQSETAVRAASEVGYPVALKLEHPALLHKSDGGGVIVDLRTPQEVVDARRVLASVASNLGLQDPRLVIQRMVRGVEVLVGVRTDESFGHVLVVGLGGTLTELVNEVRLTLLPTSLPRIRELVMENERLATLLRGYRGAEPADIESLIAEIHKITEWIARQGARLDEFDVNPIIVTPGDAFVVDARAVYLGLGEHYEV